MTNEPIIALKGLSKRYGSLRAVHELNLEIYPGEVFGLLGPNGAGKTTTILMMLGLTEPSAGMARVCGYDATRNPIAVKRTVGYLPDRVGFYGQMSALENLKFIAQLNGLSLQEAENRSLELLDLVGLQQAQDKAVSTFSRGMLQRLGLADVLIKQPQVIILDEPTLGIDPSGVNDFLQLIRRLSRQQHLTVLLSSHHLQQVQKVCDRVGIFVQGELLVEGSIDTLAQQLWAKDGHTTQIRLGKQAEISPELKTALAQLKGYQDMSLQADILQIQMQQEQTPEIVRLLVAHKLDILEVKPRQYGLDEIYETYFKGQQPIHNNKETLSRK